MNVYSYLHKSIETKLNIKVMDLFFEYTVNLLVEQEKN